MSFCFWGNFFLIYRETYIINMKYLKLFKESHEASELDTILNDIHSDIDMSKSISLDKKLDKLEVYVEMYPDYESEIRKYFNDYIK